MKRFLLFLCVIAGMCSCGDKRETALFRIHKGPDLGIDFRNVIQTNDTFNALSFEYVYNGGGIGVGDFNNDGLEDVFFAGNQVSSELYLNRGSLQMQKVTVGSGLRTDRWITGVTVVDINQDGWMDIYLSVGGMATPEKRKNLLFVNQGLRDGIPVFKEMANSYGLDDNGYSTMAAFFDYDKDGDPDMYLLNNWLERFNRNNIRPKRINGEAESTDKLYRNNGDGTFSDVSREAGILIEGYGLGVNICDINQDSWPDIYVANDFLSNDLFWINQGDGTFKNQIGDFLKHQTHNAMGVDVADFNNDELADIVVVDMLPPGHYRQKMMTAGQNYDHFHMALNHGYEAQYMRNTLQVNRGQTQDGKVLFSETAFLSGVAQTDWSWAPLFADFDNDGWKDLFIANGYRKDVTNVDFIFFGLKNESPFGTPGARKKITDKEFDKLEEVKISNFIFRNTGTLVFEDQTKAWGVDFPTFSNGSVYVDLDNDGDLDLITNNIDQEVIVYENTCDVKVKQSIRLKCLDTASYNQKIRVFTNGKCQYQEFSPYRGFQSTVTQSVHFGLGSATQADSIVIVWPDKTAAKYYNVKGNSQLSFKKADAKGNYEKGRQSPQFTFQQVEGIDYAHRETSVSDIKITRTLLHELSRNGPCIARGDVNNDQLEDLFIGGEAGESSVLYIQNEDGSFTKKTISGETTREDGAALFFDADNDGDLDLYVGSTCINSMEEPAAHILYLNDGKGNFATSDGIPSINTSTGCVIAADYDDDGDLDLFIGGRLKTKNYPYPARSYLLQNENGKFSDVTASVNESLESPGMVTSALWVDVNKDRKMDLIIAGEWMPIRVFINDGQKFTEKTAQFGLGKTNGWWNCLRAADINHDGFIDIIAGNTGKNSFYNPSEDEPVEMIARDFDKNESIDPIITYFNPVEKNRFIVHNRLVLIDQIPAIKKRFETFTQYATTPFEKSFTSAEREGAYMLSVTMTTSSMLINHQGKKFSIKELPETIQLSTLNDVLLEDINGDGHTDLIGIGNNLHQETLFGSYDASIGTILLGDGQLNWTILDPVTHNFVVDTDARRIETLETNNGKLFVIASNNAGMIMLRKEEIRQEHRLAGK